MKLIISGRHLDVTEGLKDHAAERFEKLEKYFDNISRIEVTMSVQGTRQTVEAIVAAGRGTTLVAEVDAADMYAALDLAAAKLEGQLKKLKERIRQRRTGSKR